MAVLVLANEAIASRRRVYFHLVDATDGITVELGETGGQPQVSTDGGAWTNVGISTLSSLGNGRYSADLTQTLVATAGTAIETRYKSANTAEAPGDSVRVIGFDPYSGLATSVALATAQTDVTLIRRLLKNRMEVSTASGIMTLYADDGTTPLLTAQLYLDSAGTLVYDGTAAIHRRNALT